MTKNNTSGWIALIFFTALFVMSSVIVSFLVRDAKQFDTYHQQLSYQTTYSLSYELEQHFKNQERLANLLANSYQDLFNDWVKDPNQPEKYQQVKNLISLFFPDHYTFMLSDHHGNSIGNQVEEKIGKKCLSELDEYAQHHSDQHAISSIHPDPLNYHYDLFIPISPQANQKNILLISFSQDKLIQLLAGRQATDHQLMIVHQKEQSLIELTGYGGRNQIQRPFHLLPDELELIHLGIGGEKAIEHSFWSVVDMVDPEKRNQKQNEMYFGILLTTTITLLLALIGDLSLSRYRQAVNEREKLLLQTNTKLELEVEKRTALLMDQQRQLKLAANVFEQSSEGIVIANAKNHIIDVNHALLHITGFTREELIGHNPRILSKEGYSTERYKAMWLSLKTDDHWHGEINFNSKKHDRLTMQCAISVIRDEQQKIINYISIYTDITPLKTAQKTLEKMAYYDRLTGLPNRTLLFERMEKNIAHNKRNQTSIAVCYLDLDGFKPVNDTLGHDAGDELLKSVAIRLENVLRPEDTAARLGGDEFVILINSLSTKEDAKIALNRVMQQIQMPFVIHGQKVEIGVSIGVSFYPEHGDDIDQLLRVADQAMYRTKRAGKNHVIYAS